MGLFDYIFKSKKEREQDARVKDLSIVLTMS